MSKFRELRRTYGFDEVAIAPGAVTINPAMTDTKFSVGDININIPILGSAMDAVASPDFASAMHSQGALSVMNLEGVQTRYESPQDAIDEVINTEYRVVGNDLFPFPKRSQRGMSGEYFNPEKI